MAHDLSYHKGQSYLRSLTKGWFPLLIAGAIVLGLYLFVWHQAHLFSVLPLLIILACPLMHIFRHGHGHKHRSGDSE